MAHDQDIRVHYDKHNYSHCRNNKDINTNNNEKNKSQERTRNSKRVDDLKQYYTSKKIISENKEKMKNYIKSYMENSRNKISNIVNDIEKEKENIIIYVYKKLDLIVFSEINNLIWS